MECHDDYRAGVMAGVHPMTFAVHSEFVNRPATVIVEPGGRLRMAYIGTFWGDRPTIAETLDIIENDSYEFRHPERTRSS